MLLKCLLLLACSLAVGNASFPPGTVLDIQLGNVIVEQFIYLPTGNGYKYGYGLADGSRRDEVGIILTGDTPQQDQVNANNYKRNERPPKRPGVKNRKLAPKSLQSLAG
ncbi:uncharacterized protein LOC115633022 [Scaptodrosophila lebanonensis]|uniref:Uncharacterized protein LOC115633022 n=1 Tax=Drosophila lebanonensis TaxID=7225 RepID=A0A6J2UCK6_DROLE|nr:uncharacterized protein LOC115633022 [Scaptodrosophila lebanonensis]